MSGMTVPGRAVQVLSLIDDQHASRNARLLKLDTQVLRDITRKVDKEGHPLAVIVIAGPERQGKSFMLTYFVRYLQALEKSSDGAVGDWMQKSNPEISMKDQGFNFENAFERTTEGIWMWSRPFIIPEPSNPGKKIAVLLMDTEGCYGSSLTNQEQAALVGLSLLTSSVFVYNETTRINDSTMATVGKFMQYGQLASQMFQGKIFHRIMFLIRDWNCPNIFEYGAAGGQGFIREFFREKPRMTKEAVEYRSAIMKHFEDCNAYLMPHPGQAVLSDKFSGSVVEMTPEFCYHVENFVMNLFADVGPKMLRDNPVTGSSFASLFQAYVNAFNASDMPSPASILKATLYIAFDTEIRSLAGSYESSLMTKLTDADNSGHLVISHQLDQWGRKIADSLVSTFEKKQHECAEEDKILYVERLKVEIDRIHKKISEENETSRTNFIQRSAAAACAKFESFLQKQVKPDGHYWKRSEFDAEVNPAQEQCLQDFLKASSSFPAEHVQLMVTDASDKMNEVTEALWTELAARTAAAENKANEIIKEALNDYICNMKLLIADDVQPEATLEKFHNKEANIAHVGFKRGIETEFKDAKFIMESTEMFSMCLEAEYMEFKESNESKLNEIRDKFDAEIGIALALFESESAKVMEDVTTADGSILKGIYGSAVVLALEAFLNIATPDGRFLKEYIRKCSVALKAALDEAVAILVRSVEAKQLQCKQLAQNACREFNDKLSSWIETTGTVSPGTFDDRSHEFMQNQLTKCEAELIHMIPEYSNHLRDAQELMEQTRQESAAVNSENIQQIDDLALQHSETIKCSYEASLQKSVDQCKDLTGLKKLYEEISSKFLSQFRLKMKSCKALSLYDNYEATCRNEMAEIFNEKQHQFLQKTEGLKKLRNQRIPQCGTDLRDRMEDKIRKNPFISEADVDLILQEEWPEVKHSLIREIKSEITLNSTEFLALVDEIENQLEETKKEVKQKLRVERDQGDENAESIYQNVLDFAKTELSQVVKLLVDGSRNNVEEDFQTWKSQVDSKFEDEWPYEPCSKKDSIKRKIHSKLDDELDNAHGEILKKMSGETTYVAESMESVLSSFARAVVEVLEGGKYISMGTLEDRLMREIDLKIQEKRDESRMNVLDDAIEVKGNIEANLNNLVQDAESFKSEESKPSCSKNQSTESEQHAAEVPFIVTELCTPRFSDAKPRQEPPKSRRSWAQIRDENLQKSVAVENNPRLLQLNEATMNGLLSLVNEAIDVYENSMKQFEMGQSFECRKVMFSGYDQAARSQALQVFEAGSSQVQGFEEQHDFCLKDLMTRLNKSRNSRRGCIVQEETRIAEEQARKSREQARFAQEDSRRKKEEAEKIERESRRQLNHAEVRNPRLSYSENFHEIKNFVARQQRLQKAENDGKRPSDTRAQFVGASSVAANSSLGLTSIPSHEMPSVTLQQSAELAIHMGLHRTQVAFITPATGRFNLIANVRNRLYWNVSEEELTPAFDEALVSDHPVINFERDLALSGDRGYDFILGNWKYSWNLQDVLSRFLVCLKRKAEVDLRMEFNACVVAVPQFFNESQRVRLRQSATIAGFDTVTFVNDTTAIAVVHMVDEETVTGNVVVVNTHEGPVDIASFAFDHGILECHGVTGDCFFENHNGLWGDLKGLMYGVTELFVGHSKNTARLYFTQKELGISPSSSNTKYLLLGKGENYEACLTAIRRASQHPKVAINDSQSDFALYGTAYICCLRSRDPCNSVLLKWQDKLERSSKVIDSKVLDELERKILKPDRNLKKNMNMTTAYTLTSEEVLHRRNKLNTSKKVALHRDRLALLKLINLMETSQVFLDHQVSASTQLHLDSYSKQLFPQDLNPDKLKKIHEGLMALRDSS